MYDKAGLWKNLFQPLLGTVPYRKVMTFPQGSSELKNFFLLFSLQKMNRFHGNSK
jgi:hypothetical protein